MLCLASEGTLNSYLINNPLKAVFLRAGGVFMRRRKNVPPQFGGNSVMVLCFARAEGWGLDRQEDIILHPGEWLYCNNEVVSTQDLIPIMSVYLLAFACQWWQISHPRVKVGFREWRNGVFFTKWGVLHQKLINVWQWQHNSCVCVCGHAYSFLFSLVCFFQYFSHTKHISYFWRWSFVKIQEKIQTILI